MVKVAVMCAEGYQEIDLEVVGVGGAYTIYLKMLPGDKNSDGRLY